MKGQRVREELTSHDSCVPSSPVAAAVCASDQDSGVEDEDLSPRPSPSPHLPTQQVSVMMDSRLLIMYSFNTAR